jgi:hypothetical protein
VAGILPSLLPRAPPGLLLSPVEASLHGTHPALGVKCRQHCSVGGWPACALFRSQPGLLLSAPSVDMVLPGCSKWDRGDVGSGWPGPTSSCHPLPMSFPAHGLWCQDCTLTTNSSHCTPKQCQPSDTICASVRITDPSSSKWVGVWWGAAKSWTLGRGQWRTLSPCGLGQEHGSGTGHRPVSSSLAPWWLFPYGPLSLVN